MFINFFTTKIKKIFYFNNRLISTININLKYCYSCRFFIKPISNFQYKNNNESYGLCSMFIEKNIISGYVKPISAISCRIDNNLCGLNAKKFKKK